MLHWHTGAGLNPFPPPGLPSPWLFTHKHILSFRAKLSQVLLHVVNLSMPQPSLPGVPRSSYTYRGCGEPDCSDWQAVMQLAASRRATATSMLGPATKPALHATAVPANVVLTTLHNTRSRGDTTVAFTRLVNCDCTVAAPHSQEYRPSPKPF